MNGLSDVGSHRRVGLAIMNPSARIQITQYAKSVADLFKLMIQEKEEEFRARIRQVGGLQSSKCGVLTHTNIFWFDVDRPVTLFSAA